MHHGVRIQDAALVAAAVLSRPLHHRPLPARQGHRPGRRGRVASCASRSTRMPTEIDVVERRIRQLEIERVALRQGDRRRSRASGSGPSSGSSPTCSEQAGAMRAHWDSREGGDRRHPHAEGGAREADAGRGRARGRPRHGRPRSATASMPELERERRRRQRATSPSCSTSARMLKEEVDEEDIADGRVAGGPAFPCQPADGGRGAEAGPPGGALHERVVGQDEAVHRGRQRHPPQPRRPVRPEPADRLVPVPRPHRRRQDRAGPGAGRVPLRRRAGAWSAST